MWKLCAIILTAFYCFAGAGKIAALAHPVFTDYIFENSNSNEDATPEKDALSFEDLFHARKTVHHVTRPNISQPLARLTHTQSSALSTTNCVNLRSYNNKQKNSTALIIKNCVLLI